MKKNILIALAAAALVSIPAFCATAPTNSKVAKTSRKTTRAAWRPETLSGKISMVDPARRLVVIQDSNGVPFDMVVKRSTQIKSANGTLKLTDLNSDMNRDASIKFVPERRGDVAETIRVM